MFAIFSINIFHRSYVLIFNFFSDEYLILRASEDLKNSILDALFGEIVVYNKSRIMQFCCALFHDLLCKISSLHTLCYIHNFLSLRESRLKNAIKR